MSDVVWSINIMLGILLSAVGYLIYWIMTYDDRTESRNEDSNLGSEGGTYDGPREGTHSESSC